MKQAKQKHKAILNKLHEVQRLVAVIQALDAHDPERALAVARWMIEAEEATILAAEVQELLSVQELADLKVATSAISNEETQRWEKKRIEIGIMRLWTGNEHKSNSKPGAGPEE